MQQAENLAPDTLAVILAGGQGARLGALTRHVCKPALPFGGAYRNVDFSLSNCVNSGIRRIGIATQHNEQALVRHVDSVWLPRARRRGVRIGIWSADRVAPGSGYRGTADAVFKNLAAIVRQRKRHVLVLAGDHVYRMDYRPLLEFHRSRQAGVTVAAFEVAAADARQFGVMALNGRGRVERFLEKPQDPSVLARDGRVMASMGIYVFDADFLAEVLRADACSSHSRHDFGADIVPGLIAGSGVFAYHYGGVTGSPPAYWRDVGTPKAYWQAHLDLLEDEPRLQLGDAAWPLPTAWGVPARLRPPDAHGASGDRRSLIAAGCEIEGHVRRSVVFPAVRVARGSVIDSTLLLPGAHVGRDCRLTGTIVDRNCHVPDGTVIDAMAHAAVAASGPEPVIVTADDFAPQRMHAYA